LGKQGKDGWWSFKIPKKGNDLEKRERASRASKGKKVKEIPFLLEGGKGDVLGEFLKCNNQLWAQDALGWGPEGQKQVLTRTESRRKTS